MHRNIRTTAVAYVLFIGASGLSLAAETAAPSTKGVGGDPTALGTPATGNTGSPRNPNANSNPAAKETGMDRQEGLKISADGRRPDRTDHPEKQNAPGVNRGRFDCGGRAPSPRFGVWP
jgi:hypothetical protein